MRFKESNLVQFWPPFDVLWREELSLDSSLPLTWQEREPYRKIAENTYNRLIQSKRIKAFWDDAYDDGYDQGLEDGSED